MAKHHSNLLLIFCLILALIGVLIVMNFYIAKPGSVNSGGGSQVIPQSFADITPGPKTTTILAPNGKMNLIVKEEKTKDGTVDTFYSQTDSSGQVQIYTETLAAGTTISVPYNTFSPDNKYIFLKKTTPTGVSYFVLKTDGTAFKNSEQSIDFVSLFNSKYPDATASDVTGWGGMTLIVINHNNPDGTVKNSFWYDVASNSIIPLSTKFF